jgi:anti-anti-sigma factor
MPVEKWSESVALVHLANDPQFTDDLEDLDELASPERFHAVLDFGGVDTINSSNLARLLRLRKLKVQAEKRLVLCNLGPHVTSTLLVTGLDNVFEVSQDVSTALATLQMARM